MRVSRFRLDALLVQRGLASGRDQAKAYILAGQVNVNGCRCDKAGTMVEEGADLTLAGPAIPFVSRGGLKLEKALTAFAIKLDGLRVLDLGASTGGFTDCALQRGASQVVAVDVGYGQLAWALRNDPRVKVLERTNARYLTPEAIGGPVDFCTADLAFISLTKILPVLPQLLSPAGQAVVLVKPQFEAGREQVGKKGVVRDAAVHEEVIRRVAGCAAELGLHPVNLSFSPVTGPEGNIEYLLQLSRTGVADGNFDALVAPVVAEAHRTLHSQRR